MPIFEYRCRDCGAECEIFLRNRETPLCPRCQGKKLEKLISATAGHVGGSHSLPIAEGYPPADAPICSPTCCRLPQ